MLYKRGMCLVEDVDRAGVWSVVSGDNVQGFGLGKPDRAGVSQDLIAPRQILHSPLNKPRP